MRQRGVRSPSAGENEKEEEQSEQQRRRLARKVPRDAGQSSRGAQSRRRRERAAWREKRKKTEQKARASYLFFSFLPFLVKVVVEKSTRGKKTQPRCFLLKLAM